MRKRAMSRSVKPIGYLLACLVALLSASAPASSRMRDGDRATRAVAATPAVVFSFPVPGNRVSGLGWGDGSLWLLDVDDKVYRMSPNGLVQSTFTITTGATDLAWDGSSLWINDAPGWQVYQLDASGQISDTLNVGYWPGSGLEWAENYLYVGDYNSGDIHKHDRAGQHLLSWQADFFGHPTGITYDGNGLWIGDSCEGYNNLYHYSLLGTLLDVVDLDAVGIPCDQRQRMRGLAWDGEYLWYTADNLFTVYKLDLSPPPPPEPTSITPANAKANAGNVPVVIGGADFRPPATARLADVELLNVTVETSNTIRAVVPVSGLSQGIYDLIVTSEGQSGTLTNAFTVKPASIPPSPPDQSWKPFGLAEQHGTANGVGAITVDPHNSDIVYASDANGSTGDNIHKTVDKGKTWQVIRDDSAAQIAVHPNDSNTIYVAPGHGDFSLYKTADGGTNWTATGCCPGYSYINAVLIDRTSPSTVYAGLSRVATNAPGVYRSLDGGAHWSQLLDEVNTISVVLDPHNPRVIYATAYDTYDSPSNIPTNPGGVYKSADWGVHWTRVFTHTVVNALAIDPQNSQVLYAATEGSGIFKSADGGASWARANTGLPELIVRALAIDPSNPRVLYAGLWEQGVFRSLDAGLSWNPINTGLGDLHIQTLALDPSKPYIMYAGTKTKGIYQWVGPPPPAAGTTYAHVVDAAGHPVIGAQIYRNGAPVRDARTGSAQTDIAGNLVVSGAKPGDTLVATLLQEQRSTRRLAHNGWAYRVHTTNLAIQPNGGVAAGQIAASGAQTLTVRLDHPLVLFNLVVSIEWDADIAYTAEISRAMQRASNYLFDMTDGQMAFGQVAIVDRGQHWANADIQIAATNIVRPHAFVGGLTADDTSHVIRVGRAWNGNSGNQGPWDQPDGFRTLGHEFGHYALYLYDEYFGYIRDKNGNIIRESPASCIGPQNRNRATDATNVSVMDYHYASTELAMRGVAGRWSSGCEATAQWQLNHESDWETLTRKYADSVQPARWRFITPVDRAERDDDAAARAGLRP
jgi:hypothetical protein